MANMQQCRRCAHELAIGPAYDRLNVEWHIDPGMFTQVNPLLGIYDIVNEAQQETFTVSLMTMTCTYLSDYRTCQHLQLATNASQQPLAAISVVVPALLAGPEPSPMPSASQTSAGDNPLVSTVHQQLKVGPETKRHASPPAIADV